MERKTGKTMPENINLYNKFKEEEEEKQKHKKEESSDTGGSKCWMW